ncbi:MAG: UDP-N-acetylmuramate--L-alanine ligase [Treponema sp.]|jgi:UDP-N-acetylmuramate--alanine ligase|nr:UDP-N-acetylmuramate--L-alanine ligase [Treponema sp.]
MEPLSAIFRPGASVYFTGIKGTGVCALAELMLNAGMRVSGSDTAEVFYTDSILQALNIPYHETFDAAHIGNDIDIVIHSAAYSAQNNCELAEAMWQSIPVIKYPDALGAWSAAFDSAGIAGVHGKTTTTAIAGVLMRAAGLPAQILAGSAVADFNGRSTLTLGMKYFAAETCEYRKHFLAFHPRHIILTAVESDHQDFFPSYESIRDAFLEYCRLLPVGGELIYCADDPGACETAAAIQKEKRGITLVPYGFTASGGYRINSYRVENERAIFNIAAFPDDFCIRLPGRHEAQNTAAALALVSLLVKKEFGADGPGESGGWNNQRRQAVQQALEDFHGAKRRSEIIGEAGGIIFIDDYGHHPTAIQKTLEGLQAFYPHRRLVVSFMSHTYTRTAALLEEFARSLAAAAVIFLHKIYASAREQYDGTVNGKTLYEKVKNCARFAASTEYRAIPENVYYVEEPLDAFEAVKEVLADGDLFITLGAGNNWPLGVKLFEYYKNSGGNKPSGSGQ